MATEKVISPRRRTLLTIVVIIGLACIPLIYSSILTGSYKDPIDKLNTIPAAIVNNDQPAQGTSGTLHIGADLTRQMLESENEQNLGWKQYGAKEAATKLESGDVYAVLTIPKDFSANVAAAQEDPKNLKPTTITFTSNDSQNYIVGKFGTGVADKIKDKLAHQITAEYLEKVNLSFTNLHKSLDTASEGAGKLSDGAGKANEGAGKLTLALGKLQGGANTLAGGNATLAGGANALSEGAGKLSGGASKSAEGADKLAAGLNQLAGKTGQIDSAGAQLNQGTKELADKSALLSQKIGELNAANTSLADNMKKLAAGSHKASEGAASLQAGAASLEAGAAELNSGLQTMGAKLDQAPFLIPKAMLVDKIGPLLDGAAQLSAGAKKLNEGATALVGDDTTGLTALATGADQALAGAQKIAEANSRLNEGGTQLSAGAAKAAEGTSKFTGSLSKATTSIGAAANGANRLADGTSQVANGASQLQSKAPLLAEGAQRAAAGADKLSSGLGQAGTGAHQLQDGTSALAQGNTQLKDSLSKGAAKVPDYTAQQARNSAENTAGPVTLDATKTNDVGPFGFGVAPYFMSLAMWVGAIAFYLMMNPLNKTLMRNKKVSALGVGVGSLGATAAISVAQALLMLAGMHFIVGLEPANRAATVGLCVLTSFTFVVINQALIAALGPSGRFIALLLIVLQLGAAGGIYPVQTAPKLFQVIHDWLPITYTVDALRAAIGGGPIPMGPTGAVLGTYIAISAIVVLVAAYFRRHGYKPTMEQVMGHR